MTKINPISIEQWRVLIDLMRQIQELAPWDRYFEDNVFAIEDPATKEIGYISLMGASGEHYAVCLYRGEEAYNAFRKVHDTMGEGSRFEELLETSMIQAQFDTREYLEKEERAVLRNLGVKVGKYDYLPHIKNFCPGYLPEMIDSAAQAELMMHVLEQSLFVYRRGMEMKDNLSRGNGEQFLLRKTVPVAGGFEWIDSEVEIPDSGCPILTVPNQKKLDEVNSLPMNAPALEVDVFMLTTPVKERGQKAFFPFMFTAVDENTGFAHGFSTLTPEPDISAVYEGVPDLLIDTFKSMQALPANISVRSQKMYELLLPTTNALHIKLEEVTELPMLEEFREEMIEHFNNMP